MMFRKKTLLADVGVLFPLTERQTGYDYLEYTHKLFIKELIYLLCNVTKHFWSNAAVTISELDVNSSRTITV